MPLTNATTLRAHKQRPLRYSSMETSNAITADVPIMWSRRFRNYWVTICVSSFEVFPPCECTHMQFALPRQWSQLPHRENSGRCTTNCLPINGRWRTMTFRATPNESDSMLKGSRARDMAENSFLKKIEAEYQTALFDEHVTGTPTLYINEVRYTGATDVDSFLLAIKQADTEGRIRFPERSKSVRGFLDTLHRGLKR